MIVWGNLKTSCNSYNVLEKHIQLLYGFYNALGHIYRPYTVPKIPWKKLQGSYTVSIMPWNNI